MKLCLKLSFGEHKRHRNPSEEGTRYLEGGRLLLLDMVKKNNDRSAPKTFVAENHEKRDNKICPYVSE